MGFVPDLGNGNGIGINFADVSVPIPPKTCRYFIRHIQPPAVNTIRGVTIAIWIHPAFCDVKKMLPHGWEEVFTVGRICKNG